MDDTTKSTRVIGWQQGIGQECAGLDNCFREDVRGGY